jgi:tetratricopeptide (TPR) repeat protein
MDELSRKPGVAPVSGQGQQPKVWLQNGIAFDGQTPPAQWPSVSLCMIVKNEEDRLAECVKSVGDFAGEIIIVDTGSTDRTVEIAAALGATVRHFTWIDDFAAARNESIRTASSDWIFWMDADDRLAPEDLIRLKQAAASEKADAYYCNVVSHFKDGAIVEDRIEHLRLFRNHRRVQFEKPLHEDAAPAASRLGLVIARTNITIRHTGYAITREQLQTKARRNLQIIETAVRRQPDDLQWRFHLGVTLNALGDYDASIGHLEAVVSNPPPLLDRDSYLYQAYEGLLLAYVNTNQPQLVRQTIERVLAEFSYRQHCWIRVAEIYLALDEPQQAISALGHAATLPPDVHGQSFAPGTIENHLTTAYLLLGQVDRAKSAYLSMLSKTGKPLTPPGTGLMAQARTLSQAGEFLQAVQLLEPVAYADASAMRLLANGHAALKSWPAAANVLAAAIALGGPQPGDWTSMAKYTLNAEQHALHARRFCLLALAEDASDAAAPNLLGVIAMAREGVDAAIGFFVDALLVDRQNQAARNNLAAACRSINISQAEAVRKYSLWLMQQATNMADHNQVLAALSLLVDLNPHDAQPYKLMAVTLQKLGREHDALTCWQTAQKMEAGQ